MTKPLTWNGQPCVIVRKYEDAGGVLWLVIQTMSSPGSHSERILHVKKSTFDKAQGGTK